MLRKSSTSRFPPSGFRLIHLSAIALKLQSLPPARLWHMACKKRIVGAADGPDEGGKSLNHRSVDKTTLLPPSSPPVQRPGSRGTTHASEKNSLPGVACCHRRVVRPDGGRESGRHRQGRRGSV